MSPLLIALLGVLLLPLFLASWRSSLIGLGSQGFLMTLIAYRLHPHPSTPEEWLTLFDFAVVRCIAAPVALYTVLHARHTPARNDVIPANLLSWTLALGIVLLAFNFSDQLVPAAGDQQTLVAVATAGVLLGCFVLASQSAPFSQMIGALRIENATALLILGSGRRESPFAISVVLLALFIATLALFRWYLDKLPPGDGATPKREPEPEGPTL